VNTTHFDPKLHEPLDLPARGQLVFGRAWVDKQRIGQQGRRRLAQQQEQAQPQPQQPQQHAVAEAPQRAGPQPAQEAAQQQQGSASPAEATEPGGKKPFRFISAFKWEHRKVGV
jgi:hypothetical protein